MICGIVQSQQEHRTATESPNKPSRYQHCLSTAGEVWGAHMVCWFEPTPVPGHEIYLHTAL